VTLRQLEATGVPAAAVRSRLAASIGLAHDGEAVTVDTLVERFDPDLVPSTPWRP
jgi:glutamyl-tRNA synthetase